MKNGILNDTEKARLRKWCFQQEKEFVDKLREIKIRVMSESPHKLGPRVCKFRAYCIKKLNGCSSAGPWNPKVGCNSENPLHLIYFMGKLEMVAGRGVVIDYFLNRYPKGRQLMDIIGGIYYDMDYGKLRNSFWIHRMSLSYWKDTALESRVDSISTKINNILILHNQLVECKWLKESDTVENVRDVSLRIYNQHCTERTKIRDDIFEMFNKIPHTNGNCPGALLCWARLNRNGKTKGACDMWGNGQCGGFDVMNRMLGCINRAYTVKDAPRELKESVDRFTSAYGKYCQLLVYDWSGMSPDITIKDFLGITHRLFTSTGGCRDLHDGDVTGNVREILRIYTVTRDILTKNNILT